ncbi:bifunctional non-homologous end joining protein LigD [Streptacidiphilus sp. MAP12-16]|uniref:non-homologous end-joining DNA ligase n=1 Tax=Streptacidiphilus sp. MAP12-16 TaxID=3156300 RepID=UPI0035170349
MPGKTPTQVDGHLLALSHLDKLLWPGFTKGEALHYLAMIAPVLLPHTAGRPASFVRFPEGIDGPRFYAKNPPPGLPEWVGTAPVPSKEGPKRNVVVETLGDLVALGNLYALEIHVPQWTTTGGPERHDRLVIDLDPGPGAGMAECCAVALLTRERLADDGLTAWVKTSGSKGLHLYAPIAGATGEAVLGYAKRVAQRLERDHPDLVVHKMLKALRTGRVLVDWSQNSTSKTTAAPYTLRAVDPVSVSAPISWDDVEAGLAGSELAFTPDEVLHRVERHGDLLAGLLDPRAAHALP